MCWMKISRGNRAVGDGGGVESHRRSLRVSRKERTEMSQIITLIR